MSKRVAQLKGNIARVQLYLSDELDSYEAREVDLMVKNERLALEVTAYNKILRRNLALLGESSMAVVLTLPMSEADMKVARLSKWNS